MTDAPADTTTAAPLPEPEVPDVEALELAAGFAPAGREQWRQLVKSVLVKGRRLGEDSSGAQAEDALATMLPDGISVRGLYTAADHYPDTGRPGSAPFTRGRLAVRSGWDVRALHEDPDISTTNRAVLDDLEGGATSVWLRLGGSGLGGSGLGVAELPAVLDGVLLDLAPVVLDAGAETGAAADAFFVLAGSQGIGDESLLGVLGADPLGLAARTGTAPDFSDASALAAACADRYPGVRAMVVDALVYAEAGATDAQELGLALATGLAYLRALTGAGMSIEAACAQLEFRYAATADQFATIAKLRAARRLWARVCEVSGVAAESRGQRQHAVTSWSMLTRFDAHTNLLRTTLAAFGAGVGGADAVTVLPFDTVLGLPDPFSRRIARNTSALLTEESHVAEVTDPAGGSWAVEALTDAFARAGWAQLQEIEAAGGMAAALAAGLVGRQLAASAQLRHQRLSSGTDALIGVSEFPDLTEALPTRAAAGPTPATAGPTGAAVAVPTGGLPRIRTAEVLEQLRLRSAAATSAAHPQQAHLIAIGAGRARNAALAAVEKSLRPGGIEPVRTTLDDLSGLAGGVAVLCQARDVDASDVEAARAAALAAGATLVLDGDGAADMIPFIHAVLAVTAPEPEVPA